MSNKIDIHQQDEYHFITKEWDELLREVQDMEENSRWLPGIPSRQIEVIPLMPIEVSVVVKRIADDLTITHKVTEEAAFEAASEGGSHFVVKHGSSAWVLRSTSIPSLHATAKLYGSAFSRMSPDCAAEVLNHGLRAAKDRSLTLLLERYGRIAAMHSDNVGGYRVMPISELLTVTDRKLRERFGRVVFEGGDNSHSGTMCDWSLPDKQDALLMVYEDTLDSFGIESIHSFNLMPIVQFFSSDTGSSSATAIPMFRKPSGATVRFTDGIAVKHIRRDEKTDGVPAFEAALDDLYAKFTDMTDALEKLATVRVNNPVNVLVGLSNKLCLPKKYADAAREDLERLTAGHTFVPMHDVYLSMSDIPWYAREAGASPATVANLEEQVARILRMDKDWTKYDVGGIVEWGQQPYTV